MMGGGRLCETAAARFCKDLWARLRVHRSGSVHGLWGRDRADRVG